MESLARGVRKGELRMVSYRLRPVVDLAEAIGAGTKI